MRPRLRLMSGMGLLLLIIGVALLTWAAQTGRLTIFGDDDLVTNADLTVMNVVDLAKGAAAGDRQLTVRNGALEVIPGVRSGNAVFVVGQREVVALHRIVPILDENAQSLSKESIAFSFAGSIDGISFSDYSPVQPVVTDVVDGVERPRPIELGFLIPEGSRFVRAKAVLSQGSSASPRLRGFSLNYTQRATLTSDTTLLVNGTPTQEPSTATAPTPGRPATLVVTGPATSVLLTLLIATIGTVVWRARLKEGNGRGTPRS